MLNAAIIGLGWWGKNIALRLKNSDRIKVTHVADLAPDRHMSFIREHGFTAARTFEEVLKDPSVDLVILCTPNWDHASQIAAAANAGKHVFCEKPLVLSRKDAEASVSICRRNGVMLGIGHERRFEGPMVEIERMVKEGAFGTVMHAEANFSHDKLANVPPTDWRRSAMESPAAGMTAMGVHLTDAFLNLFGPVEKVLAMTASRVLPGDNGDVVSAMLRHRAGMTSYINAVLATPLYLRLTVFGTKAWAECRNETHPDTPGPSTLTVGLAGGAIETTTFEWVDTVKLNLHHFADYIAGTSAYCFSDEQIIGNIAVLEAVVKSAQEGVEASI
ncbi:Gfo/Idh/MocA family protein [Mesorhizobium sp. 1B3]|uniref:Gfo/Idh/MocA family protein n=1 Tax=Mesorhizobium sp. 1B3 TaxID=3243599 RepID=UPI003D97136D